MYTYSCTCTYLLYTCTCTCISIHTCTCMFTHTKGYSVAHPNLMKLAPASRAHSAHLEILQLLFLSSVASTAPRCDSSFLRQSILPESYIWGEYTHEQHQDLDQREPCIPALTATHTYIVHSETPHTINNYMVHEERLGNIFREP